MTIVSSAIILFLEDVMRENKKKFFSLVLLFFVFSSFRIWAETYYVCVASYWNESFASKLVSDLEEEGVPAVIDEYEKGYDTYYRVLISLTFDTAEEAKKKCQELKTLPVIEDLKLDGLWICKGNKILDEKVKSASRNIVEPVVEEYEIPVVTEAEPEPELVINEPVIEEKEVVLQPIILTTNENNEIKVSEEKPYSVKIRSHKEAQAAENDKRRLKNSDIDAYILKTYDEKELFTFDVHAGAFETIEETEELQKKLEEMGIENTEISDFEDIEEGLELYDEMIEEQEVVFENVNAELPGNISEEVQSCIRQFPVNKDFQIRALEIWDMENARKNNYSKIPEYDGIDERTKALSVVSYRDDLFGKDVYVFLFSGEQNAYEKLFIESGEYYSVFEEVSFVDNIDFSTAEGTINCKLYTKDSDFILNGTNSDKSFQLFMIAENFTLRQFNEFLNNCYNDSSYLVYPQLRKSLFVLPVENKFIHRDFVNFSLNKIEMDYAKEKNYADWAMAIVGHWSSDSIYFQDGKLLSSGFFDLEYDYNAKMVHTMFMDAHRETVVNSLNHPSMINNVEGWFLLNMWNGSDELSFATKSYIIALDSYSNSGMLSEQDLLEVAQSLQIWE